jgi:hypothetical protein
MKFAMNAFSLLNAFILNTWTEQSRYKILRSVTDMSIAKIQQDFIVFSKKES